MIYISVLSVLVRLVIYDLITFKDEYWERILTGGGIVLVKTHTRVIAVTCGVLRLTSTLS